MKLRMKKKNVNQLFKLYFYYQYPSPLIKELDKGNQIKNNRIVKHLNESLIDLTNSARKRFLKMKMENNLYCRKNS